MFRSAFLVCRRERNERGGNMEYHGTVVQAEPAEAVLRGWWLQEVNRHCQEFVGILISVSKPLEISPVQTFLAGLPVPAGPAEEVVMKAILLDLMLRIAGADDVGAQPRHTVASRHVTRSHGALRIQPGWSGEGAARWATALVGAVSDFALRSAALRATCLMRDRYDQRWTLGRLARDTGASPQELAASVRELCGITPRQYLERVRVDQAITRLQRGDKIEFIPADVGYGSRKNMNGAFRRVVGLCPSRIRALSESEIEVLKQRIERCFYPTGTHHIGGGTNEC
jgi:AraC-like DNA-binding protein